MPYYFNRETNESSWQPPPNSDLGVLQEYLTTNLSSANGHPEKIRVRHLLVKHSKSRRPSSWKEVPPPSFFAGLMCVGNNYEDT